MSALQDFSYSSTSTAGLNRLREMIGDIDQSRAVFTDGELNNILSAKGSMLNLAAAEALRRLKMRPEAIARKWQVPEDKIGDIQRYASQLDQLIEQYTKDGAQPTADDTVTWALDYEVALTNIKNGFP